MSVELPPWKQEGTEITKADGDSLDRLIEFNDKHNRKKDLHRKILYLFIGYATYVLLKYLFDVSANFGFLQKFFERNLFLDLFIGAVLYFTSKFVYDLKEKAKDEYHSLRNEIVDLCNKEWIKNIVPKPISKSMIMCTMSMIFGLIIRRNRKHAYWLKN